MKTTVYIDSSNLHAESRKLGVKIDYNKFFQWLCKKYDTRVVYLFMGYIPKNHLIYKRLNSYGYKIIFKETVVLSEINLKIKGNCDADLVLKICRDYYEQNTDKFVVITGDGDFKCLVNFLLEKSVQIFLLFPSIKSTALLLIESKTNQECLEGSYNLFSE